MKKTVLIVEDSELNMELFDDLLQSIGYNTISSPDGSNLLSIVDEKRPDLIVMDIQLPNHSGLELTRDIKAQDHLKDIPIIAVSAFAMKGDEQKILAAGCDEYVAKPISVPAFIDLINRYLA